MRSLIPILLLLPALAQAQTQSLTLSFANNTTTRVVGPGQCDTSITFSFSASATACEDLQVWLTTGSCGNDPVKADGDVVVHTVSVADFNATRTGTGEFAVTRLPIFSEEACGVLQDEVDVGLCGRVKTPNGFSGACDANVKSTGLTVTYDALPPSRPVISDIAELDEGLRVTVASLEAGARLRAEVAPAGSTDFVSGATTITNTRSVVVNGLENGTTYSVRVVALDAAGNESEASEPVDGTPVPSQGFWGNYKDAGGQDTGGCSAVGGLSASWALLALGLLRRRRS